MASPGIRKILRLSGSKATKSVYHFYENTPVDVSFSGPRFAAYSIELDEYMNFAGQSDNFQVDHPESVFATVVGIRGVLCGGSSV